MYNRYIPGSNGIYERKSVPEKINITPPCDAVPVCARDDSRKDVCTQQAYTKPGPPLKGLDIGDLLLICIVLLLLVDSEEEDVLPLLITAAAFLLT